MTFVKILSLFFSTFVVYKAIAFVVRRRLRKVLTALDDLSLLALSRKDGDKIRGTAVICGGSIAGLLSARVCSDHFQDVIIVEPEAWLSTEEGMYDHHRENSSGGRLARNRSRVPQYTSIHAYQPFTPTVLRKLFNDFDHEIRREGARFLPSVMIHISGIPLEVPYHQYPKEGLPDTMFLTRPGYETTLRRLVLTTCANVKYVTGSATGFIQQPSTPNYISSVSVRNRMGEEQRIPATLVVDCTGSARCGFRWLQHSSLSTESKFKAGSPSVLLRDLKTSYDPKVSYSTCEFDVPTRLFSALKENGLPYDYETVGNCYVYFADAKIDRRTLSITRRENNFLQIVCGGWNIRTKITSVSDIKFFVSEIISARPLPAWIHGLLDVLQNEQVPVTYVHARSPPCVYIQYHRAKNLPANFIVLGDSALQLNPARGQGCTKACVEAVTLNSLLTSCVSTSNCADNKDRLPAEFSQAFFSAQARRTGYLWTANKLSDYSWESTIPAAGDDRDSFGKWRRAFSSELAKLAFKDRETAAVMWHIGNWLAPPTDVYSPQILVKIARMRLSAILRL